MFDFFKKREDNNFTRDSADYNPNSNLIKHKKKLDEKMTTLELAFDKANKRAIDIRKKIQEGYNPSNDCIAFHTDYSELVSVFKNISTVINNMVETVEKVNSNEKGKYAQTVNAQQIELVKKISEKIKKLDDYYTKAAKLEEFIKSSTIVNLPGIKDIKEFPRKPALFEQLQNSLKRFDK